MIRPSFTVLALLFADAVLAPPVPVALLSSLPPQAANPPASATAIATATDRLLMCPPT
jgi:hypothetical protein